MKDRLAAIKGALIAGLGIIAVLAAVETPARGLERVRAWFDGVEAGPDPYDEACVAFLRAGAPGRAEEICRKCGDRDRENCQETKAFAPVDPGSIDTDKIKAVEERLSARLVEDAFHDAPKKRAAEHWIQSLRALHSLGGEEGAFQEWLVCLHFYPAHQDCAKGVDRFAQWRQVEPQQWGAWSEPTQGLRCRAGSVHREYAPGAFVDVIAEFENTSTGTIRFQDLDDSANRGLLFHFEETPRYSPAPGNPRPRIAAIDPGKSWIVVLEGRSSGLWARQTAKFHLTYDSTGWLDSACKTAPVCWRSRLECPPFEIEVRKRGFRE